MIHLHAVQELRRHPHRLGQDSETPSGCTLPHAIGLAGSGWLLAQRYWCGGGSPVSLFSGRVCHRPRYHGEPPWRPLGRGWHVGPRSLSDHAGLLGPLLPFLGPQAVRTEVRARALLGLDLHGPGCVAQEWASGVTCSEETKWTPLQPCLTVQLCPAHQAVQSQSLLPETPSQHSPGLPFWAQIKSPLLESCPWPAPLPLSVAIRVQTLHLAFNMNCLWHQFPSQCVAHACQRDGASGIGRGCALSAVTAFTMPTRDVW